MKSKVGLKSCVVTMDLESTNSLVLVNVNEICMLIIHNEGSNYFNQNILCRKACELHFKEEPIKIAYARGQYMYDEKDNRYLDCVNNVTHGMCMPPLDSQCCL